MFLIPPEHLNFFTIKGLRALFEKHGFVPVDQSTVSRLNVQRIAQRLKVPFLQMPLRVGGRLTLGLGDHLDRGMFINAYFRKAIAA